LFDAFHVIVHMLMIPPSTSHDDRAWVARLQRWGLDEIAPVLFDVLRPFGFIGSQLLALASPVLTTFVDARRLDRWIDVLDSPEQLEEIIRALDREAD
jgi:hypothetical protein